MPGMYEDYLNAFNTYSQKFGSKTVIFMLGGIFYELYDAIYPETGKGKTTMFEVADILGLKIAVHKGDGPGGLDGHVAGITEHVLHKWAGRLTSIGWTVVVMGQTKNPAGKVVKREVERVLTPGSHIEAAGGRDCYLTFVCLNKAVGPEPPSMAVVALDLNTAHTHVFETVATGTAEAWTSNEMVQFMELYPPREILWSVDGPRGFLEALTEGKLRSLLGCSPGVSFHRREALSGAWNTPLFRDEYLQKKCQIKNLLPTHSALALARGSNTESALISLLSALDDLWPSLRLGALLVYPWVPGKTLCLGENALVQLHMLVPGESNNQDVLGLFDSCCTPMGARGLRERLLKPSACAEAISSHLDAVEAWTAKPKSYCEETALRMRKMCDMARVYRKIQQGSMMSNDVINLDTTLKAADRIAEAEGETAILQQISAIRDPIFKIFSKMKAYEANEDKSLFCPGVVPRLDDLETQLATQHTRVTVWIGQLNALGTFATDTFKPEFREKTLIIKGPRSALQTLKADGKTPKGAEIKIQKTGSYIESPELDGIYASIQRLRSALSSAQTSALIEFGQMLSAEILDTWLAVTEWITALDVNLTLATVAVTHGYIRPQIIAGAEESHVEITGLRHPLLEVQDRRTPYVQHDVHIGASGHNGWLLYGLNASGKSSLMRAVGLSVLLAQAGSFVPARVMRLAPFASLHTRIINTDNLWMGLSSFAVEMSEMRDIFREAGPRSLVLGDELCSGTETTSATALVAAGLRGLLKRGAKFLFATHLHGLAQIPEVVSDRRLQIWHLHVEHDHATDKLIYHRTLRSGSGSALYGLEVARAMRIPADILEDAVRFRKQLAGEAELSTAIGSAWNSSVVRRACENCGAIEVGALEVHHIRPRMAANSRGRLADGSDVHSAANLAVLCDRCHDAEHAGELDIQPMIQTSDGLERSIAPTSPSVGGNQSESKTSRVSSKWTEEELATIGDVFQKFPNLSMPQIAKYLLNEHDIKIHASTLRKMRCA